MIDEKARNAAVEVAKEMVADRANHWEIADAVIEAYESAKPKEAEGHPVAWAEEYGGKIVSVALREGAFHKTPLYRAMLSAAGDGHDR